jgi:hypothetical protein
MTKSNSRCKPRPSQIKQVIECALKLFTDKAHFTTGRWAEDAKRNSLSAPKSPDACAWCLEGGLMKCSPDFPARASFGDANGVSPIYATTAEHLKAHLPREYVGMPLQSLNDDKGLPAVRRLLRKGLKSFEKKVKVKV